MTIKLIWILFGHYVLDYPLQGEFLATTKGKMFSSLVAHSMIYSCGMSLILYFNTSFKQSDMFLIFLTILFSHMVIDFLKSNAKDVKKMSRNLILDQSAHLIINLIWLYISFL